MTRQKILMCTINIPDLQTWYDLTLGFRLDPAPLTLLCHRETEILMWRSCWLGTTHWTWSVSIQQQRHSRPCSGEEKHLNTAWWRKEVVAVCLSTSASTTFQPSGFPGDSSYLHLPSSQYRIQTITRQNQNQNQIWQHRTTAEGKGRFRDMSSSKLSERRTAGRFCLLRWSVWGQTGFRCDIFTGVFLFFQDLHVQNICQIIQKLFFFCAFKRVC